MRHFKLTMLFLGLIGLSIVAIVKAQDFSSTEPRHFSPDSGGAFVSSENSNANGTASVATDTNAATKSVTRQSTSLQQRLEAINRANFFDGEKQSPAKESKPEADSSWDATGGTHSVLKRTPADEPESKPEPPSQGPSVPAAQPTSRRGSFDQFPSEREEETTNRFPPPAEEFPRSDSNVLFSGQSPALTVKTEGPKTIVVGRRSIYKVTLLNTGTIAAKDVGVLVRLPKWAELASQNVSVGATQLTNQEGENGVHWKLGELVGQTSHTLNLHIIPRESRPIDLAIDWAFMPTTSLARIEVLEPKLEMSLFGPKEVLYGETKSFTITLSNPGTGDAENVVLNVMPIAPGSGEISSKPIGTIKAGGREVIEIELTADQAGRLAVKAQSFADGGLRAEATEDVLVRRAQLQATVAGPPVKYAGTVAAFQARVANTGDAAAGNVVTELILPTGSKYVSSSDDGMYDETRGIVRWRIGPMHSGAVRLFNVKCILNNAGENRTELHASAQGDLTASQSLATKVEAMADLKMEINDPQGPLPVGEVMIYEVKIVNRGTKRAEQIRAMMFFSKGVEPVGVEGVKATISPGEVQTNVIDAIEAGESIVIRIKAKADQPGNHKFGAKLQCINPDTRLSCEESTRFYGEAVVAETTPLQATRVTPELPQRLDIRR